MYLGRLCKSNHEFGNTGKTLRYDTTKCVKCERIRVENRRKKIKHSHPGQVFVGDLCKRNHKHQGKNKSLRWSRNGYCTECTRIASAKYEKKEKRERKEQRAKYYEKHKERINYATKMRLKKNIPAYLEENRKRAKEWKEKNPDKYKKYRKSQATYFRNYYNTHKLRIFKSHNFGEVEKFVKGLDTIYITLASKLCLPVYYVYKQKPEFLPKREKMIYEGKADRLYLTRLLFIG